MPSLAGDLFSASGGSLTARPCRLRQPLLRTRPVPGSSRAVSQLSSHANRCTWKKSIYVPVTDHTHTAVRFRNMNEYDFQCCRRIGSQLHSIAQACRQVRLRLRLTLNFECLPRSRTQNRPARPAVPYAVASVARTDSASVAYMMASWMERDELPPSDACRQVLAFRICCLADGRHLWRSVGQRELKRLLRWRARLPPPRPS